MRIRVVQSGGFAALRRERVVETERIPGRERDAFHALMESAQFFAQPERQICGLPDVIQYRVSVESGTTNRDFLVATSKKLVKQGKKAITIVTFPKDTDSFAALLAGRVDAYYADSPPAAYYAKQNSTKVQIGGKPVNPFPVGIAIRKHDPLRGATQKAIAAMYASGAMKRIVAKWGMTNSVVLLKK